MIRAKQQLEKCSAAPLAKLDGMACFLIVAVVAIVIAVAVASSLWALALRDGIRLVDRLTRRPPE